MPVPGARPAEISELTRVEDRISFVYFERCTIHRDANAITASGELGTVHIPSATLSVLVLGPGTTVSHHAMMLIADSGSTVIWAGEHGVRYYAHGRGLSRNTRLLEAQARLVSYPRERLRVARRMYSMRFPGEDVSSLTMQQLRGREGARVRRTYRENSQRTGVSWSKRMYDPDDFAGGDVVNQALSAANSSLYGVVHSVIVALGCSPGLGFVHTGHQRSFVYDIADLYKAEMTVPLAFDIAMDPPLDVGGEARRRLRDTIYREDLLARCADDLQRLLLGEVEVESSTRAIRGGSDLESTSLLKESEDEADEVFLWDGSGQVESGVSYGDDTSAGTDRR